MFKYQKVFASISWGAKIAFECVETSYAPSPLFYTNPHRLQSVARYQLNLDSQKHVFQRWRRSQKPVKKISNRHKQGVHIQIQIQIQVQIQNEHELKMFALKGNDSMYELSSTDQYIVVMMLFESKFQHVIGRNCILILFTLVGKKLTKLEKFDIFG